jgi:cell division protein FtsL
MIRFVYIFFLCIAVLASLSLYILKYDSTNTANKIVALKSQIIDEKKRINVLNAEFYRLTQPERIQKLSQLYLNLGPINISQQKDLKDIPLKPANDIMDDLIKRSLVGLTEIKTERE